jgi:hypothetical protein
MKPLLMPLELSAVARESLAADLSPSRTLRATAFGGFGLDPPQSMPARLLIHSTLPFTRFAMGFPSESLL